VDNTLVRDLNRNFLIKKDHIFGLTDSGDIALLARPWSENPG
jgi:hypothetical protein